MNSAAPRPVTPVRRRLVLHVPGYEPLSPAAQQRRLRRTLARTAAAFGLAAESGEGEASPDGAVLRFAARLAGPDWATEAEVRILAWDDLIARDLAVPLSARMRRGGAALLRLLVDGTLARYRRAHWRYLLFVALPVALLLGALLAGAALAALVGGWAGVAAGALLAAGFVALADRHVHLGHLLADWAFARDLARGTRRDIAERVARFAGEIAAARARRDVQEVVLIGHSLGMVLLAEALAAALDAEAEEAPRGSAPRLVLVGVGSSALKIGLMPEGGRLRAALARIAAAPGLDWIEFSSRRDLVSFHRADPLRHLGIAGQGPRMVAVHPRAMLAPEAWRRVRVSMLRAHRVYVTGNDRPYHYDWGMLACGPGPAGRGPGPDRLIGPGGVLRRVEETAA